MSAWSYLSTNLPLCPFVLEILYCITIASHSVALHILSGSHTLLIELDRNSGAFNTTTCSWGHLVVTAQCTTKVLLLVSQTSARHKDESKKIQKVTNSRTRSAKTGTNICNGQYQFHKPAESRSWNLKSTEFPLGNVKP